MAIVLFSAFAVIVALILFGLFIRGESRRWADTLIQSSLDDRRIARDLISAQRQAANANAESAGKVGELVRRLDMAAETFGPVRNVPCKACAGTGEIEKENALWKAIRESLEAGNRRRR